MCMPSYVGMLSQGWSSNGLARRMGNVCDCLEDRVHVVTVMSAINEGIRGKDRGAHLDDINGYLGNKHLNIHITFTCIHSYDINRPWESRTFN